MWSEPEGAIKMILVWFTIEPDPALMFEVQQAGHVSVQAAGDMEKYLEWESRQS